MKPDCKWWLGAVVGYSTRIQVLPCDLTLWTQKTQVVFPTEKRFNWPSRFSTACSAGIGCSASVSWPTRKLSITANRVEVLIAIGVMGKTRGEISEGSVAALFKVVLIVSEGAAGTYATFSKLELFYKWNPLWLYMRLWDVKRFFEIFSVLTLHRPPQISEKWGKMAHFGRFPTFSYWLVWSLNY